MSDLLLQATVERCWDETPDIRVFDLVAAGSLHLPPFTPGSHIDVEVPGVGRRQYSLCNPCGDAGRYRIAVKREEQGRGGSAAMHRTVGPGSRIAIGTPRNAFPLIADGPAVLVAGGIGVTPLLAMAEALADAGTPFQFHYFGRTLEGMAFRHALSTGRYADRVRLHPTAGDPRPPAERFGFLRGQPPGSRLYVCGPGGMIDRVRERALASGFDAGRIHSERFAGAAAEPGGAFTLHLARSGRTLAVPADRSILDLLIEAGVPVEYSCEQGVCGACRSRVLAGVPEHRDQCLSPAEQADGWFTPCCSRAAGSDLTLDL